MALLLCTTPARVRRGASLTSPLLGELPAGAVVEVQGGADRLLVRWNRRSGYVSAKCFADPDAGVAFGYVTRHMAPDLGCSARGRTLVAGLYQALKG